MKFLTRMASVAFCGSIFLLSQASELTINDYCDLSLSTPVSVKDMTPLSDGQTFAAISDDGKRIEVMSFKTGKKIKDLFDVETVKGELQISEFDGFEISDNGKKILLWNDKDKIYRYTFYAEYYVYDTFRSTLARVSLNGKQRGATMSHDGRYVAYIRDNNVFISNLDYGTDYAITDDGLKNQIINGAPDWSYEEEFDIRNTLCWNADDTVLAYMRFDESNVPQYSFDDYKGYCDPDGEKNLYPETYTYKYPLAGYPNSIVSVHAYNLDNRVTKKMDLPSTYTDYFPLMKFDGEGRNLMVMILNHEQNNLKLYRCNPGSTVCTLILNETSSTWLSPSVYQQAKFGKNDFMIVSERSGYKHLYQYDYNGNLKRQITSGNFNVTDYYGSDVRGNQYFQTTYLGAINRNICVADPKGNFKLLNDKEGTASAVFSSTCDFYMMNYSSANVPPQYTLHDSKGVKTADLELNHTYAQKYSVAPKMEFLKVKNDLGDEMNAFMIKPLNFDETKKYPLLMYQYNGPESQEVLNKWKMEGIFYIASQGYVVACVDGRGTGNRSAEWAKCVYKELGVKETEDQLAAASYFSSLPYVNESLTGCFGWSYGGYMTMMELGDPKSKFKVGVSMAGVADWRCYDALYTERFMLTHDQNEYGYKVSSALNRTPNVKGKLLLMSGTNDDNVHFYNTLKYASKLSFEGKTCDMMVYPGFEHSLRMCDARVQLFRKIVEFLNLNLR